MTLPENGLANPDVGQSRSVSIKYHFKNLQLSIAFDLLFQIPLPLAATSSSGVVLNAILHFHCQKTLLTQKDLVHERE